MSHFISTHVCQPQTKHQFVKPFKLDTSAISRTKGHSSADNFWTFLHVADGSNRQPPVCYWTPKVLKMNKADQQQCNLV